VTRTTRRASPPRRRRKSLTEAAQRYLASAIAFQRQAFDQLVGHWPAEDRERFSGYLRRLATEVLTG
jgi:DNA-binding MarR family transcriptional regulator